MQLCIIAHACKCAYVSRTSSARTLVQSRQPYRDTLPSVELWRLSATSCGAGAAVRGGMEHLRRPLLDDGPLTTIVEVDAEASTA